MLIKNTRQRPQWSCSESEVTPQNVYLSRRKVIAGLISAAMIPAMVRAQAQRSGASFSTDEKLTSEYSVTHYNNFYEFALTKDGPAKLAKNFKPKPWHLVIEGEVEKPGRYSYEDLLKWTTTEERIYRLRCVEAWSMVVPWQGFELRQLIKRVQPTSRAKFVEFVTLHDPEQMPGQRRGALGFFSLDWPFTEGLRLDEAMHPLTMLVNGVYGKALPPQNGAPLRLVVPWKYGFKSIKSIVKIRFVEHQPINTWQKSAPREYGFYANVNPLVDHPRWSQKTERRIIDESLFGTKRIETRPFNGYADQVAHLYSGMDLRKYF